MNTYMCIMTKISLTIKVYTVPGDVLPTSGISYRRVRHLKSSVKNQTPSFDVITICPYDIFL